MATITTYFAEDTGPGETGASPPDTRLASWPNSTAKQAAFYAAVTGETSEESFEGYADNDPTPLVLTMGAVTATLTSIGVGGFVNEILAPNTNGTGRHPTHGDKYLDVDVDFKITFSPAVYGLGFFAIDLGDFGDQVRITLTHTDLSTTLVTIPHTVGIAGGSICFFGFTSDVAFTQAQFSSELGGIDVFGFDQFVVVQSSQGPMPVLPAAPLTCEHPLAAALCASTLCAITVSLTAVAYTAGTVAVLSVPVACGHPLAVTPCETALCA
jgi:hypothetical protein